jgi:hypothetical protein
MPLGCISGFLSSLRMVEDVLKCWRRVALA